MRDSAILIENAPHLNSRLVNSQPLCTEYQKVKPYPLSDIKDIKIQEGLIIKDLLYVLLGFEGSYIRYSEKYDPKIEKLRRAGPDYKINKHLDSSLKDVTKRIIHLSKMFSALTYFTEVYDLEIYGQIVQSLVYEVRQFLKTYILFLDSTEFQFNNNKDFTLRQFEQDLRTNVSYQITHLYEIAQTIYHLNDQRRHQNEETVFTNFIQNIRHDLKDTGSVDLLADSSNYNVVKGGLVLRIVQEKLDENNGDMKSSEFLEQLLTNISKEYVSMLNNWISKGDTNDPYGEFFVTSNLVHSFKVNTFNAEQYWDSKFVIKKDGIPKQFESRDIQLKILLTGKYLNVVKECGVNLDIFTSDRVTSLTSSNLHLIIEDAYANANRIIIDLFTEGYEFKNIMSQFQSYYLLNRSFKLNEFVDLSFPELKRSYDQVSISRLQRNFYSIFDDNKDLIFQLLNITVEREPIYAYLLGILKVEAIDAEKALHSSNFEAIKNLISQSLQVERETGEDSKSKENSRAHNYFNIDIILPFPLNLIVTRTVVIQYQLIFRHLLNMHFTDKELNETWLEINKNKIWKYKHFDKPIPKWITRARSLHDRMKEFFKIYFSFLTHDVIELNWQSLNKDLSNVDDFEQLSNKVQSFLNTVLKNSVLTTEKLIKILSRLIQIINAYCDFLLSIRKVLILLNYELFDKYNDRLKDREFDYNKNLERLERLNSYLNEYLDSFSQHLNGFIEGLRYYGELETPMFLNLAQRLEQSFPNTTAE